MSPITPVICIDPIPSPGNPGKPKRLRDSPLAITTRAAEAAALAKENGEEGAEGVLGLDEDGELSEELVSLK